MIAFGCKHEHLRCIHGDEILDRMTWQGVIRRAACADCEKALKRGLPEPCTVTGKPHLRAALPAPEPTS